MGRSLEAKSIKSAQRVFEVLEYFDVDHQEASVMDIARHYGYPQSSASELLSYMIMLGYLRRGSRGRTYQLSMRVAMLGTWVQPRLVREGRLLPLMDELAHETGATVTLSTNTGVNLRALHVVSGARSADVLGQGAQLPLLQSAEGHALLGKTERELVRRYVHRLNAEAADPEARIRYEDLAQTLNENERRGYALIADDQGTAIAITLPHSEPGEPLALALRAAPGEDVEQLHRQLRSAVAHHLGLVEVSSAPLAFVGPTTPMRRFA